MLTASVHRLRASGCIPGALDLFGVLTATDLAARSSTPRLPCRLLDTIVTARHGPVPKRHGHGGAIRIVITILGAVSRPTQVGSAQPAGSPRAAGVDPPWPAPIQADVNRQNAARSGCHQHELAERGYEVLELGRCWPLVLELGAALICRGRARNHPGGRRRGVGAA